MVYNISNKELIRVSRKTIIAGFRQVAGKILLSLKTWSSGPGFFTGGNPKIQSMNFPRRAY
jgi:hypothetical protein